MTKVLFRKTKDGYIDAVFPFELSTFQPTMVCYSRIGQHSSACPLWVYQDTSPASPEEYKSLKKELESIGYDDLEVLKRLPPFHQVMTHLLNLKRELNL